MMPWHRIEKDHTFEIKANVGPVYRRILMDRIELQDNTTPASNRLVTRGNTIHKTMPLSKTYALQKRMMASPDLKYDEQRKVKRILHEIRNALVEVYWPDERWRDIRKSAGFWLVRRRALAGIASSNFTETSCYRWQMDMSIALTKELRTQI